MLLPLISFALAFLLLIIAVRILFFSSWLKVWFQSTFALLGLFVAILLIFSSFDLYKFGIYQESERIALVTTNQSNSQRFDLVLAMGNRVPTHFDIRGDMWQLDVRLLVWDELWAVIGLRNLYRFDRLSGRYHSIDDERSKPKTVYDLWGNDKDGNEEQALFSDFVQWINAYTWFPGGNLLYGGSAFMPVADGAQFGIYLSQGGLKVKAENKIAEYALVDWR